MGLSWRWDCELTAQVWTNCGDVSIVASGPTPSPPPVPPTPVPTTPGPTPTPPAPPTPTPRPPSPKKPTCCWSKWGDVSTCGDYQGPTGGKCNTDPSKACNSNSDCTAKNSEGFSPTFV